MSSLKDIMDVDVEPLESQAYRRKEVAAQEAARRSTNASSSIPAPSSAGPTRIEHDSKGKGPIKRRRSGRTSNSPAQSTSSLQTGGRRRSSAASDTMDYSFNSGPSLPASSSGSPRQSSRGSEPVSDMPIKYTPVTGRVSRAKKGVPVHTCEICMPAKVINIPSSRCVVLKLLLTRDLDFYKS